MIFSSKDKMRHKVSYNILWGKSWTAPSTIMLNKFLFLARTKLKSEEKGKVTLKKSDTKQHHETYVKETF